jgi:hypothetical protein
VEKFIVFGVFALVVVAFLLIYERPMRGKKKISGRGGDFES